MSDNATGIPESSPYRPSEKRNFPKFIHYAGHGETLSKLMSGLGLNLLFRPHSAGALFIEFFRDSSDNSINVRAFIKENIQTKNIVMFGT